MHDSQIVLPSPYLETVKSYIFMGKEFHGFPSKLHFHSPGTWIHRFSVNVKIYMSCIEIIHFDDINIHEFSWTTKSTVISAR